MLHFLFSFDGRISRTNYFLGALVTCLVAGAFGVGAVFSLHGWGWGWDRWDHEAFWPMGPAYMLVAAVIGIGYTWAQFALASKRWHDAGASGWLTLLSLIPGAHFIVFVILCLIPPTHGSNAYGPDPRGSAPTPVAA